MKSLLTAFFALTALTSMAQGKKGVALPDLPVDDRSKLITYSEVVEVSGASAKDLYDRFMEWGKTYHNGFAGKLRKNDAEAKSAEVFANMRYFAHDAKGQKTTSLIGLIQYTLTIECKEGKYRFKISDFNVKASSYQPLEKWLDANDPDAANKAYYLTDLDVEINTMIADMKKAMKTNGTPKKDDW